nr:MAG TPA: rich Immunoreceptor tyrosine-based activation motif [Bacteriophage sp.]DAS41578.1 MAG TPA: rich Immunoreceptor tyrosine-based activation motif [Bacteriophage sp.]DAW12072.1 MAG TPA: rich Immunoreceptor tyrosine-based activation motif [Caudoviricetes sp.]DAY36412.1 MAG TPA: rich Immunoreceptor tyrosine-based activation motif [Bacteriophage sp.]
MRTAIIICQVFRYKASCYIKNYILKTQTANLCWVYIN